MTSSAKINTCQDRHRISFSLVCHSLLFILPQYGNIRTCQSGQKIIFLMPEEESSDRYW